MTCGIPSVPPLHLKGAAEQGRQLFLTEREKTGLLSTKRSFPTDPWGCRGRGTFLGTLNVLVKRLLWREPRRAAQRDSLVSHRSPTRWVVASLLTTSLQEKESEPGHCGKVVWVYFGKTHLRA